MSNVKCQMSNEIILLISKIIKVPSEKVFLNSNLFADLGVDSLSGVEIFATLDKKYHLDIPENKLKEVQTVSDLVNLVQSLIK